MKKKKENCTVWGDLDHRVTTEVAVDKKQEKNNLEKDFESYNSFIKTDTRRIKHER